MAKTSATNEPSAQLEPTKQPVGICRAVHVYSGSGLWKGARPGIVVNNFDNPSAGPFNINVSIDGLNDAAALTKFGGHTATLGSVPVFDALDAEQREKVALMRGADFWAEWPPRG